MSVDQKTVDGIKLVSLDCDGVLTDGTLFYSSDGEQWRGFSALDGMGIKMLLAAGFEVAFITASNTKSIAYRAETLGVRHCFMGVDDKLAALEGLCAELGIGLDAVAHMGDDINDLPVLERVALPAAPPNGVPAVHAVARYVPQRSGGHGAVREFAEWLLDRRKGA